MTSTVLTLDSSVIVKLVNQVDEEWVEQAREILRDAQRGLIVLVAPELSKYEVGNALLNKGLEASKAVETLGTLSLLPITFIPQSSDLAVETYRLAKEINITYYDASFIALAKQENAVLVTDNLKHQGKANEIRVQALAEY